MFISPQPISKQSQLATQTLKLLRHFWGLWSCHFSFCLSRSFSVETFRFSPHLILPPGFQYGTIIFKSHIIKDTHIYPFPLWECSSLTFCVLYTTLDIWPPDLFMLPLVFVALLLPALLSFRQMFFILLLAFTLVLYFSSICSLLSPQFTAILCMASCLTSSVNLTITKTKKKGGT